MEHDKSRQAPESEIFRLEVNSPNKVAAAPSVSIPVDSQSNSTLR